MEYGVWSMEYGVWSMEYGVWSMEYGVWSILPMGGFSTITVVVILSVAKNLNLDPSPFGLRHLLMGSG